VVAIHGISLDTCAAGPAEGAVAFTLTEAARTDRLFCPPGWEVELRRGCDHVVARKTGNLTRLALLDAAIEITHKTLDLVSIEGREHLNTRAHAGNYVQVVRERGQMMCVLPTRPICRLDFTSRMQKSRLYELMALSNRVL
jgi:hypothetical protein